MVSADGPRDPGFLSLCAQWPQRGAELAHHYHHLELKMSHGLDIKNSPGVHAEKASVEVDLGLKDDQSGGRRNEHGDAVSAL